MQTYDIVLDGTNSARLAIDYSFFLILSDGGGTIDIQTRKNGGFDTIKGVNAGFGLRLGDGAKGREFIFSSSTPQTIKVFLGDDEALYNRLSGTVTLSGTPNMNVTNTPSVKVLGKDSIQAFSSITPLAAGATQIIAPASNVSGLELLNIDHMTNSTAFKFISYIAKVSAPTTQVDGLVVATNTNKYISGGGNDYDIVDFNGSLMIPAGMGLWVFMSGAETSGIRTINWR